MNAINFDDLRYTKPDGQSYSGNKNGEGQIRDFREEIRKIRGNTSGSSGSGTSVRDISAENAREKVLQYQRDLERELRLRSRDPSRNRREEEHVLFEKKCDSVFESKTLAELADQPGNVSDTKPHTHIVYMKTDDMLYSGGNGTGLSFYLKYAKNSTEDDPTIIAKGVDENGDEFEQIIHINQIDPRYATIVEMRALEAFTGVEKQYGFTSLPLDTGNMKLHDRRNFMEMFADVISDMNLLRQWKTADYYRYSMQVYQNFMDKMADNRFTGRFMF